jgi:hypothetical protein
MALGYLVMPIWSATVRAQTADWTLFPFFLVMLVSLRVVPALLRNLLSFEGSMQAIWAERRQLAKRFDSYQWQKLFWIGLGLALYAWQSGGRFRPLQVLTFICLLSGAIGLLTWRHRAVQLEADQKQGLAPGDLRPRRDSV